MRDQADVLAEVRLALTGSGDRREKLEHIAAILREGRGYRWVGLYDVSGVELAIVAWSGHGEPAHPRFPVSQGLCGDAATRRETVIVGDVTADARYLTTFPSTRSEIVVPILDSVTGRPRGVIDVESDRPDAFGAADRELLERCASELAAAVSASPG
jgi:L-methionine (R)-S-oxide reductase